MITEAEIRGTETAGRKHEAEVPHATEARFLPERRRLYVVLSNGVELIIPVDLLQGLTGASNAALADIEITPLGTGLHWKQLDADLLVEGLAKGIFGSRSWMASLMGRAGGTTTSPAKSEAARRNGAKGGRPRKATGT